MGAKNTKLFTYPGKDADVHWDGRLCIHVGECGRAEGALFEAGRKPWCQPDLSGTDEVLDVVQRCPTGALTIERRDGGSVDGPAETNVVAVANHGPLYVTGELAIDGADDMPAVAYRAALCRCGHSKNKPFCDNAHEAAGFQDRGAVGQSGDGIDAEGGTLSVRKVPNGPLIVAGNFSIVSAAGRVAWKGPKAALCRCGQSKNKPFCDGAHKAAGFVAD